MPEALIAVCGVGVLAVFRHRLADAWWAVIGYCWSKFLTLLDFASTGFTGKHKISAELAAGMAETDEIVRRVAAGATREEILAEYGGFNTDD